MSIPTSKHSRLATPVSSKVQSVRRKQNADLKKECDREVKGQVVTSTETAFSGSVDRLQAYHKIRFRIFQFFGVSIMWHVHPSGQMWATKEDR